MALFCKLISLGQHHAIMCVSLFHQVLAPLLANSKHHIQLSKAVTQDFMNHVHTLKSSMHVVSGQVQGKTLLAPPAGLNRLEEEASHADIRWLTVRSSVRKVRPDTLHVFVCLSRDYQRGAVVDSGLVYTLESTVIEWSHQISSVLKKDSSEVLLEDLTSTPQAELRFWNHRLAESSPAVLS